MNNNKKSIKENWDTIISEYNKLLGGFIFKNKYYRHLNKGATDEEIEEVEEKMGFSFPKELAELYKCNNGNLKSSNQAIFLGGILGLNFICLGELLKEWKFWSDTFDDELNALSTSTPKNSIKYLYTNKYWIPFASDGGANHIGIDLDPGINGCVGQVINFGRDEDNKYVLAKSLNEFLEIMIDVIKSDDFKIEYVDYKNKKLQPSFKLVNKNKPKFPTDYLISLLYNK